MNYEINEWMKSAMNEKMNELINEWINELKNGEKRWIFAHSILVIYWGESLDMGYLP